MSITCMHVIPISPHSLGASVWHSASDVGISMALLGTAGARVDHHPAVRFVLPLQGLTLAYNRVRSMESSRRSHAYCMHSSRSPISFKLHFSTKSTTGKIPLSSHAVASHN